MIFYYITIILIPFGNHPLLSYNVGGVTPIKVFGGLSLLAAVFEISKGRAKENAVNSKFNFYFTLLVIVFFMSAFVNSPYRSEAVLRFVSIIIFFITTVILVNSKDRFQKSVLLTIACMDIAAAYMFREYSLYGGMYANFRPGGILGDPNYTALNLVTVIPVALLLGKTSDQKLIKYFGYGSFILCTAALGMAQSRGGYLAFAIVLLLLAVTLKFRLKSILGAAVVLVVVANLLPVNLFSRFSSEGKGVKVSTESRFKLVQSGLEMFKDNIIFGVGPGNFKAFSDKYNEDVSKKQIAHNSYIELGAELGVLGILLFALISWQTINNLNYLRTSYINDDYLFFIFTGIKIGLVGYLIAALFLSAEFEKILWFFVFLVAAATRIQFIAENKQDAVPFQACFSR